MRDRPLLRSICSMIQMRQSLLPPRSHALLITRHTEKGITTFSYMEATIGKGTHGLTSELQTLIKNGMFYFHQAIDLHGEEPRLEVPSTIALVIVF